jgi:hypothetical protein
MEPSFLRSCFPNSIFPACVQQCPLSPGGLGHAVAVLAAASTDAGVWHKARSGDARD